MGTGGSVDTQADQSPLSAFPNPENTLPVPVLGRGLTCSTVFYPARLRGLASAGGKLTDRNATVVREKFLRRAAKAGLYRLTSASQSPTGHHLTQRRTRCLPLPGAARVQLVETHRGEYCVRGDTPRYKLQPLCHRSQQDMQIKRSWPFARRDTQILSNT